MPPLWHPPAVTQIHPRRITCPLCSTSFDGHLVLAGAARGPLTSDLRRLAEGDDPIPLMINSCPECAYTGEVSAFEEMAPAAELAVAAEHVGAWFDQDSWSDAHDPMLADRPRPSRSTLREQLAEHLAPRAGEASSDPALRYEHHAQVVRWTGLGPLREGDAWLRAAWLYGDRGAASDDQRCRRRALDRYRQGVTERRWFARREDLVIVAYLTGELHRRLGEPDEAGRWFEQAVAWSSGLQKMQDLVQLAERQGREPRDLV